MVLSTWKHIRKTTQMPALNVQGLKPNFVVPIPF